MNTCVYGSMEVVSDSDLNHQIVLPCGFHDINNFMINNCFHGEKSHICVFIAVTPPKYMAKVSLNIKASALRILQSFSSFP